MPDPRELPGPAYLVDTLGFGLDEYCGAFLLPDPSGDGVAIVDTGPSVTVDRVLEGLRAIGRSPGDVTHVLPTHIHLDHAGATWRLLEACPDAQALVHENGAAFLTQPDLVDKLLASVRAAVGEERFHDYGTVEPLPEDRVTEVAGGERIHAAGRELEIVDAPGHAPHQYNVHDPAVGVLYVGDAAGIRPPGGPLLMTTPPPAFDLHAWRDTLDRLEALEADTLALTHFGTADAVEHLARFREAQEAWVDRIRELFEAGVAFEDAVDRLAKAYDEGLEVYDEATFHHEIHMNTRGVWDWLGEQG
jgi:glyoxylase-like metal-dependent hydrolase (beta-lactamase superfamily II)